MDKTTPKTAQEFAASILDDATERRVFGELMGSKSDTISWQVFKLAAAYKRGNPDQRRAFNKILSDEQESEMWQRFLQSKSQTVARAALRLAKKYGVSTAS